MIKEEPVKIRLTGIGLKNILNKSFLDTATTGKFSIKPIGLFLAAEEKAADGKVNIVPIILNHASPKDFESSILQIDCSNAEVLEYIKELLKKLVGD